MCSSDLVVVVVVVVVAAAVAYPHPVAAAVAVAAAAAAAAAVAVAAAAAATAAGVSGSKRMFVFYSHLVCWLQYPAPSLQPLGVPVAVSSAYADFGALWPYGSCRRLVCRLLLLLLLH